MAATGITRPKVNRRVSKIRHVFKWAVAEELVPVTTWQALLALRGLQAGRCESPEPEPVIPVPDEHVEAVLPHLRGIVRAMVQVQRLTGMLPGEVCRLRPSELKGDGEVWEYRPARHKTAGRVGGRPHPTGEPSGWSFHTTTPEYPEPLSSPADPIITWAGLIA